MKYVLGLLLLAFLGALAVFALQNTGVVTVSFLNWQARLPLALLAVGIYLLGMLTGWNVVALLRRLIRGVTAESTPPAKTY